MKDIPEIQPCPVVPRGSCLQWIVPWIEEVWGSRVSFLCRMRNMFVEQAGLCIPQQSARIWRYMDFAKLVDLLNSSQLYFSSLLEFADSFEGAAPRSYFPVFEKEVRQSEEYEKLPKKVREVFLSNVMHWSKV